MAPVRYEVNYCVATTGLLACPNGYPARRVYYKDKVDTRACSCSCGAPVGAICTPVTVIVIDNAGAPCSGGIKPVSTVCSGGMGNTSALVYDGGVLTNGSCPPAGEPTGAATPAGPMTICCLR